MSPVMHQLITKFDFERNEFMIGFYDKKQALAYKAINREARIFVDENARDVWLPKPKGLQSIGTSSGGLSLEFESDRAASRWCDKVVIGRRSKTGYRVLLVRDWNEKELWRALEDNNVPGVPPVNKNDWPQGTPKALQSARRAISDW